MVLSLLFLSLGLVSWPVTRPLNWFLVGLEEKSGWHLSVSEARWIPYRVLELTDLKLKIPGGGRMHILKVSIYPRIGPILSGRLMTQWRLGEGRIDPGSWGIRRSIAQEMLSAGPVTREGEALIQMGLNKITLQNLTLQGPLLQLQAEGWMNDNHQAQLNMEGALARKLLEGMSLIKPEDRQTSDGWEPFKLHLQGELAHPEISFASNFFSVSLKTHGE